MISYTSLGSGSRGNCTLVRQGRTLLMVDCGFTLRETQRRLARVDLVPGDITAILVTHEHSDHAKGVESLARTFAIPVYMSHGTSVALKLPRMAHYNIIHGGAELQFGEIDVKAISVPHDSREALQFIFQAQQSRLGVLTDLGHLSNHVIEHYKTCHGLVLEFNHDTEMLRKGPYPYSLQKRVGGDWGHLNNEQAAALLSHIPYEQLQQVVVSHISEKNNCEERVMAVLQNALPDLAKVIVADQENGFPWLHLG